MDFGAGNGEVVPTSIYNSELIIQNQQLRIYSNFVEGFKSTSINGFNLVRIIDNFTLAASPVGGSCKYELLLINSI